MPTQAVRTGKELWPGGQKSGFQSSSGPGCRVNLGKFCPHLVFYFSIYIMDVMILVWPVFVSLCEILHATALCPL